jgi:uncharacterized protein (DUF1800 family)
MDKLIAQRKKAQPKNISLLSSPLGTNAPTAGISEYTGPWDTPQVAHLLKRTLFGVKPGDVTYFRNKTMAEAVDELLLEAPFSSTPPLNNYNVDGYTDPSGVVPWQTWIDTGIALADKELNEKRNDSFKLWWLGQVLNEPRSIHEKLVVFWHNHFATRTSENPEEIKGRFWYNHYITIRQEALRDFKKMVKDITLDPAMLYFLNNNSNTKTSPNENYARELQELYTVGKGPGSQYTEADVRAAARILTGHTVNPSTFSYSFQPGDHDESNKEFSAFYGNRIITGRTGPAGTEELDDLLNVIFAQEEVAKFICRKLYRFFVYYDINATIEAQVITPLATIFRNSNYDIKTVLSALFKSEHFYDMGYSSACIIKSPLDFVIGLCREFEVILPSASEPKETYTLWDLLGAEARAQQQELGAIPEVAGWYAYYQEPVFHEWWINSTTYSLRAFFTDRMIADGITRDGVTIKIDAIAFAAKLPDASDPNKLISDSLDILFRYPLSDSSKEFIKRSILLSGQTEDYYWTNAWNLYKSNPTDDMAKATVDTRLQALYKYLMNLPEYHLA